MENDDLRDYDFTEAAWESLYDVVDDSHFHDRDAQLIYTTLKHRMKLLSFGDYLKRYIYLKAELTEPFADIPLKEYQLIIRSAFSDNHTPPSFKPTTAKLSALSKNWLTQQTVKRQVVFLLGFGLNMSADDVNLFLTKALREPEINPKNPFEVICWYCYKKHFNYLKFEKLWEDYNEMPVNAIDSVSADGEQTIGVRNSMYDIRDDRMLMAHLSKLKAGKNISVMSATAKACFDTLYGEARDLIAKMYNSEPDTAQQSGSRSRKKAVTRHDITESDMEQVLCSAIPKDHHGNLTPGKRSKLNEQFAGKRFSRQRISDILAGRAEVTRFDLITLNFFIFSQKLDVYPDPKQRYVQFQDAVDELLEKCFMGKMYVQNPYECFVLMCILSDDPLATYADVWEMSFVE